MSLTQAQTALLLDAERHVGAERRAAVLSRGRCPAPRAVIGKQERAEVVRDGGRSLSPRAGPWWRPGRGGGWRRVGRLRHGLRIPTGRCVNRRMPERRVRDVDLRKRKNPGDDLFSRKAALSVSSALESLTSVFGMGTGVASPPESPGSFASGRVSASDHHAARAGRAGARAPRRDLRFRGLSRIDITRSTATDPWSVAEEVKPSTVSTA